MAKYRITLVEPHGVKTRDLDGRVLGTFRPNTPLHTQPIVAGSLIREVGRDFDVQIYNPKIVAPEHEELYRKTSPYGNGSLSTLHHWRVGESIESKNFREISLNSDIMGITANHTQFAHSAIALAKKAKEVNPGIKVVYGGSDACSRPHFYLSEGRGEVVVPKDGETTGPRVVSALVGNGRLENIPSIAYRSGEGIRINRPDKSRGWANRMISVPLPAFQLVKEQIPDWTEDYKGPPTGGIKAPLAYAEFARGCPERCGFCTTAGTNYSFMETGQVKQYARHLKAYGISTLLLIADNELAQSLVPHGKIEKGATGRELLIERFAILKGEGFKWNFWNGLQISLLRKQDGSLDSDLMHAMFSGAYEMYIPSEGLIGDIFYDKQRGNPKVRRMDGRNADEVFESNMSILEEIARIGVPKMTLGFIVGYPHDSLERVRLLARPFSKVKERLKRANPGIEVLFTPLLHTPLLGTRDYQEYSSRQLITCDIRKDPELWQFGLTTYAQHEMVEERLRLIEVLNGQSAPPTGR